MSTAAVVVLVALVLGFVLHPLVGRRALRTSSSSASRRAELDERYRSALADLQDADADHEVGNLSDSDFEALRARHRERAAVTLRELDEYRSLRAEVRTQVNRELGAHALTPALSQEERVPASLPLPLGEAGGGRDSGRRRVRARPALRSPVVLIGLAAAVAVAGVVALYLRAVGVQSGQAPLASLPVGHAHTVAILDDSEYWVGHHDGLLRSVDGRSWQALSPRVDVMGIASLPIGQLVAGHDVLLQSPDGGATWVPVVHDLPGTDIHGAQTSGAAVWAYVVDRGVFRSTDGARWEQTAGPLAEGVSALAVLPRGGIDLLFLAAGGRLIRSPDAGRTWASASGAANLALNGIVRGVAAESARGTLYAATSEGVFRSATAGSDWTRLPFRGSAAAIGVRGDRVAVVDDGGRFFLSLDAGGTWTGGS